MKQRVVITGYGIHSCIGTDREQVKTSLREGRSGIGLSKERKEFGYISALCGMVSPADLKGILPRNERVTFGQQSAYAYFASEQALAMAQLSQAYIDAHEVGILFGNDSCAEATLTAGNIIMTKHDTRLAGKGAVFQELTSTVTMNLGTHYHLKGINMTLSAACASGSHALGLAWLLVRQGLQECIVCGGAQETGPCATASFDGLGAFSTREDAPTEASRPFDRDRDGLVPSGGAAALIVESLESARARGARPIAEIVGYGFSGNGDHLTRPNADGLVRAMRHCLESANLQPTDIDYINAHATSTPAGDSVEASAIDTILQGHPALVTSTKCFTGHEMWMAGASEAVYSLIMMEEGFVAPQINLHHPDSEAAKLNIPTQRQEVNINTILSNSFGFGGTNATIALRRFQE